MANYLNDLNINQQEAAIYIDGPSIILAGAGSGKTRVLTYRIAHILNQGHDAFNILALTFTNKAAAEMKDRIDKMIGKAEAKNVWMGTFHSVFAKILRVEGQKLGYPHNFTIYDTDDCKSVLKDIIKSMQLDVAVYKPSLILHKISSLKNSLVSASQYSKNDVYISEDFKAKIPQFSEIFLAYQLRNFKSGAMDFDDLLYNTNMLLRDFPEVLNKYQDKFKFIMVDEYQDTNFSQYIIIKQLAAKFQNICVVGDDAQSIYSFRGANIQNILNFKKDYPEARIFKLEQNYRSTQNIVNASNSIIDHNKEQFKKTVFSTKEVGQKITVIGTHTDNEEGQKISWEIFQIQKNQQNEFNDFCILYRTNAQSRAFEESLRKLNIPYKIFGGTSFYQRKEIKDALAYFRLAINNNEDEALKRIINYPARGIGQTTLDKIQQVAIEHQISMWEVIANIVDFNTGLNAGAINKINEFVTKIKNYSSLIKSQDAYEIANTIVVNSGLMSDLNTDKTPEGEARVDNVNELLNAIKEFVLEPRTPQELEVKENDTSNALDLLYDPLLKTLDEFMQDISLLTNDEKGADKDQNTNKVALMTIHASKGLEFPYVFIVGMEENLFPSHQATFSRTDLEEERRLFYVAVTRAEKKVTCSYATTRFKFGNIVYAEPSRFLNEIDKNYIEFIEPPKAEKEFKNTYSDYNDTQFDHFKSNFNKTAQQVQPKLKMVINKPNLTPYHVKSNSNISSDNSENATLQVGSIVEHEKFGRGEIINIEGQYPESKAEIVFKEAGSKTLLLKYARLKKM